MKVPLSWLNEYIDISGFTAEQLAEKLTFSGVEVEGIEHVGTPIDDHFVVAEVVECVDHPNSDHLHLCQVNDGTQMWQIVCGAPNCRAGLKTALARVGAIIPNGGFEIKPAKLRGVNSNGMMCSGAELNLSADHDGILELDPAFAPGTPLKDALGLPEADTVLDLEITWNRSDCLSIIGIAREFSALLGRPLKKPGVEFAESEQSVNELASVRVDAADICPRYTARVLTSVKDGPSPEWMSRRLELCGIRSLGLIVDVTNYVMLECGQPLHAFDHTTLADSTIIVRRANDGEKMKTLDGVERTLSAENLVIADAQRPVALAGVMGGLESEIESQTGTVLIESALFSAPSIKRTATAMNLHSESSHRYERGVDPDLADWASRRATSLLARYGGGIVAAGVIDVDNRPAPAAPITLSCQRVNELIGLEISQARVVEILESLGIVRVGENTFLPPTYRVDLECDADLIEEIARINGLDALPDIAPVSRTVAAEPADALFRAQQLTRQTLLGLGLNEAMNYSYLSQSELDAFSTAESDKRLVLPNPVSADYGVMRDSLLPQLSAALGRNHARQVEAPALFEIGRVFFKDRNSKPAEALKVAFGFVAPFGRNVLERRRAVENTEALQTIKGLIEALLARLHSDTVRFVPSEFDAFEKGSSVDIIIGKRELIGRFGLAKESLRHPYRLHAPLALAELDFAAITRRVGRIAKLKPVPAFPPVRRDLAIVAPPTLTCAEIEVAIRRSAPKTLAAIKLFDVYKNSRAFSLEFRATDRTLTDDEVNDAFNNIRDFVKKSLNVEVRES